MARRKNERPDTEAFRRREKHEDFSALWIDGLKPLAKPYREFDGRGEGLGIQVFPSGQKSWFYAFRTGTTMRTITLGSPGPKCALATKDDAGSKFVSLAHARELAIAKGKEFAAGLDPLEQAKQRKSEAQAQEKAIQSAREAQRRVGSFDALVDAYCSSLEQLGRSSAKEVRRMLERDAVPVFGAETKASAITADDVADLYDRLKKSHPVKANRLASYLSGAFQYAREHDRKARRTDGVLFGLSHNPARGEFKRVKEKAAKRDLEFSELRTVWAALHNGEIDGEIAYFLRFLIATGCQRVRETLRLEWSEISFESMVWDMPAEKTKGGWKKDLGHVVPLTAQALAALECVRVYNSAGKVFKGNGRANGLLDTSVNRALQRWREKHLPTMPPFTTRDLRRTFKTGGGKLGLSKEIRDKVQSHVVPGASSQNYDRFDYADQKRLALETWCAVLTETPAQSNVKPIRKRA
jgi:integrase